MHWMNFLPHKTSAKKCFIPVLCAFLAIQPIACQLARSRPPLTPPCIKVHHCHLYISGIAWNYWQKFKSRCPCASMRQKQTGDLFIKEMLYRYKTPLKGCFVYKMNAQFYLNLLTFFWLWRGEGDDVPVLHPTVGTDPELEFQCFCLLKNDDEMKPCVQMPLKVRDDVCYLRWADSKKKKLKKKADITWTALRVATEQYKSILITGDFGPPTTNTAC